MSFARKSTNTNGASESSETDTSATPSPKPKKSPTPAAKAKAGNHKPELRQKRSGVTRQRPNRNQRKEVGQRSIRQICEIKVRSKRRGNAKAEKNAAPQVEKARATAETAAPPPRAIAVPTPAPSPQPQPPRAVSATGQAQVVIEKSGIEEDQGFEPPPSPPPRRWFLAVESSSQLPLPNKFRNRCDPARAGQAASLAIHCRAQQRHAAGQRARLRLLPSSMFAGCRTVSPIISSSATAHQPATARSKSATAGGARSTAVTCTAII